MLSREDAEKVNQILRKRKELLTQKLVPPQSEFTKLYRKNLANVILDNMSPIAKELLGLADPLKPPKPEMLIALDYQKPEIIKRYSRDVSKALTHEGVLAVGDQIIKKENEAQFQAIMRAVEDVQQSERYEYDRRLQFTIKFKNEECEKKIAQLSAEYEAEIENLRNNLRKTYGLQCAEEIQKTKQMLHEQNQETVREAVDRAKNELSVQYEQKYKHYVDPVADGNYISSRQTQEIEERVRSETRNEAQESAWRECKKRMNIQKHMLLCRNIVEIMHIVCAQKLDAQRKITQMKGGTSTKSCTCENIRSSDPLKLRMGMNVDGICYRHLKEKYSNLVCDFVRLVQRFSKSPCCNRIRGEDLKCNDSCGAFVFPPEVADELFCSCSVQSVSSFEQAESCNLSSEMIQERTLKIDWHNVSSSNIAEKEILEQINTHKTIPENTDSILAKQILSTVKFDEIIDNVLAKTKQQVHPGRFSCQADKFAELVKEEFRRKCNQNTLMDTIANLTYARKNSAILAATDSVELFKLRKSASKIEPTVDFLQLNLPSSVTRSSIHVEALPCNNENVLESSLQSQTNISQTVPKESTQTAEIPSDKTDADILKLENSSKSYWSKLVKVPKYMIAPFLRMRKGKIYHETTADEWNNLLKKINEKSQYVDKDDDMIGLEHLPKLANENTLIEGTTEETEKPLCTLISREKVRSILRMLEQNDDIANIFDKDSS